MFCEKYSTIHRFDTNKLRNIAKLFAHILYTDSIDWRVFEVIKLSLDTTTASSRIFLKILFQEMSENMGLRTLAERLNDEEMEEYF